MLYIYFSANSGGNNTVAIKATRPQTASSNWNNTDSGFRNIKIPKIWNAAPSVYYLISPLQLQLSYTLCWG